MSKKRIVIKEEYLKKEKKFRFIIILNKQYNNKKAAYHYIYDESGISFFVRHKEFGGRLKKEDIEFIKNLYPTYNDILNEFKNRKENIKNDFLEEFDYNILSLKRINNNVYSKVELIKNKNHRYIYEFKHPLLDKEEAIIGIMKEYEKLNGNELVFCIRKDFNEAFINIIHKKIVNLKKIRLKYLF